MEAKNVVITSLKSEEARDAAEYLAAQGYTIITVPEDIPLWDEEKLSAFFAPYAGKLWAVIHPAPERILGGVLDITRQQWEQARDEGIIAAWCVTKVAGTIMRAQKHGSIIYLNSIHAEKPVGKGLLYSIGCGAAQMLSKEANQDYGVDNVNIFFVQRGITESDMGSRSDVSTQYYGVDLRYPSRKMPERGYLNGLLAFLLTDAASPLTGSDIKADGGMTMYYGHRYPVEGREYFGRR